MPAIAFRRALGYQIDIETGENLPKRIHSIRGIFPMSHGTKTMAVSVIRWPIPALFDHFLDQGGAFHKACVSDVVIAW